MEDDPPDADQRSDYRMSRSWDKFRSKFPFRRRRSSSESTEQAPEFQYVESDILYSSDQIPDTRRIANPKIDISAVRGPDNHPEETFPKFKFSKPPRAPGLNVNFAKAPPAIIGIGGDESEEPTIAVSRRKHQSLARSDPRARQVESTEIAQARMSPDESTSDAILQPLPISELSNVRKRLSANLLEIEVSSNNGTSPSGVAAANGSQSSSPKVFLKHSEALQAGDLRQRMRADEGRAFLTASPHKLSTSQGRSVGFSDSEASSRSASPSPHLLSAPGSRGSETSTTQTPHYASTSISSPARKPAPYYERVFSEGGSMRPPSSGSESSLRNYQRTARHHSNLSDPSVNAFQRAPAISKVSPNAYTSSDRVNLPNSNPHRRDDLPKHHSNLSDSAMNLRPYARTSSNFSDTVLDQTNRVGLPTSHPRSRTVSQPLRFEHPVQSHQRNSSATYSRSSHSAQSSYSEEPGNSLYDRLCSLPLEGFHISATGSIERSMSLETVPMPWRMVHVYQRKVYDEQKPSIKVVAFEGQTSGHGSQSSFATYSSRNRTFRLDSRNVTTITLHSDASPTSGISINPQSHNPHTIPVLQKAHSLLRTVPTTQAYHFPTLSSLHAFEHAITAHTVTFDGVAHLFHITRRRAIVPTRKTHDATDVRIQILHDDSSGTTRLAAFFPAYELAECLAFELKRIDVFETTQDPSKDGLFCIKLVDAKFALPERNDEARPSFVALDALEYPSEHEDITVGFDDSHVRNEFAAAMPAPVTEPRKFTLKRRI